MKDKSEYIKARLKKSEEALKSPEVLIDNHFPDAALSRLYYAAFYAINALLINLNLNPKTHQGVRSLFHKEFIHTGLLDHSFSDFYTMLMAKRFEVDYDDFPYIDEERLPFFVAETKKLIQIIKEKLNVHD